MYRIVKLNMFFGSLLCTEDHIELNEIVEYFVGNLLLLVKCPFAG